MCWNIRWLDWYFVCGIWSSFLNTTQHRRREVVGKIQKHSLFEILALCLNRPVQNIYEAHISLIFKRLTMWSKSVGKKYLKCLDKYCIIWSHKWCQDVTRFLLNKWKITESMPPPQPHTSGVNIPHEQTQRQIWKSIKGSEHALGPSAPTFSCPRRLIFPLSVPLLSGDRSPFLHYQCDSHWSVCFWDHTVCFLLCVSDDSSRLLLLEKYTKSHDDAAASHPGTLPLPWWDEKST